MQSRIFLLAFGVFATEGRAAVYYSRANGNWNVPNSWSNAGYGLATALTYPGQNNTTDVVYISGHVITVTANVPYVTGTITLNQLGVANPTKLLINAGFTLNAAAMIWTEANVAQDMDLEVSGVLNITNGITITRSATNTTIRRMRVYGRNAGVFTLGGQFTYIYTRSGGEADHEILLDNTAQLNIGGNLVCSIGSNNGGNNQFNLQMNNTAQLNVTGQSAFTILANNDGDDIVLDLNGGTFNSTGLFTITDPNTATSTSRIDFEVDGATVNANAGLTLNQGGGSVFNLLLNSNSTANPASLYVGGNCAATHGQQASDLTLQTNNNSSVYVEGDLTMSINDNILEYMNLDLNGGIFTVNNDLTTTVNGSGNNQRFNWTIDGSATMTVGNNVSVTQSSGGPFFLHMNKNSGSNAGLTVGNDFIVSHTSGSGRAEIDMDQQSDLIVGRDLTFNGGFSAANEYLWIGMRNNNTFNVGRDLLLTMTAGTHVDNDLTVREWSGTATIGRDVIFTKSAGDEAYWNQDGGSATVGRDMKFNSTGGDDCWMYLDGVATMNITRDLSYTMTGGDQARLYLNETAGSNAVLSVGGDLNFTKAAAAGDVTVLQSRNSKILITGNLNWAHTAGGDQSRYRLTNDLNFLSVGGDMNLRLLNGSSTADDFLFDLNGGPVTVGDDVLFQETGGDDFDALLAGPTVFDIGGDLTMDHTGGDDMMLDMNNNNDRLYVDGNALMNDGAGGTTTTTWRMDNSSQTRILGNMTMTATAGGQILWDLNNSAYVWLKGSLIRSAAPNHFGSLSFANNATIEFNGTANTQLITDDGGNGGDYAHYEKVVINNTFGTYPQLTTEGTTTIWHDIQFQNGVLNTAATRKLVVEDNSTSNVGNAGSFVDGPMRKIGNANYTYPVGDNQYWARLSMLSLAQADNNTEFDCEYVAAAAPNNTAPFWNIGVDHVSHVEYWNFTRAADVNNDANCQIKLFWESATRSAITDNTDLRVAGYRSSNNKWNNHGGSGVGGATGSITSSTVFTEHNKVTFASGAGANPLPIELLAFTATPDGDVIDLNWSTATEHGNDHFEVERSADGVEFLPIATITGAGSSLEELHYATIDAQPITGLNFYRLKQVDFDGAFTYSAVVVVHMGSVMRTTPVLYPNPGSDELNIALPFADGSTFTIELFDALGRLALSAERAPGTGNNARLNTTAVRAGTYHVVLRDAEGTQGSSRWLKVD